MRLLLILVQTYIFCILHTQIRLLGDGSIEMNGETMHYFKNNAYAYTVVSTKQELMDNC